MPRLAFTILIVSTAFARLSLAQLQDNRDKKLTCDDNRYGNQRQAHKCDIKEQNLASVGQLTVEPGKNGAVSIKGWTQPGVLVRARTEAWANSDSEASLLLSQVHSDASAGRVAGSGPESTKDANWSVSYEIFVPQNQELKVTTMNGPVSVWDVMGRMDLNTKNGPLDLKRVSGDITGKTQNGPVKLELAEGNWQGRQLDLATTNGPVNITVPANFQAHIQAETTNGPIRTDFGGAVDDSKGRARKLDLNVGAGGATLKVTTTNGPINVNRPGGARREVHL